MCRLLLVGHSLLSRARLAQAADLAQDVSPFLQLSLSHFWSPEEFAGKALVLLLNLLPSPMGRIRAS